MTLQIRNNHRRAPTGLSCGGRFQATVDVLQEAELIGKVCARRQSTPFLRAERWIGKDDICLLQFFAGGAKRVSKNERTIDAMQHRIHQGVPMRVGYQLHANKCVLYLKFLKVCLQFR